MFFEHFEHSHGRHRFGPITQFMYNIRSWKKKHRSTEPIDGIAWNTKQANLFNRISRTHNTHTYFIIFVLDERLPRFFTYNNKHLILSARNIFFFWATNKREQDDDDEAEVVHSENAWANTKNKFATDRENCVLIVNAEMCVFRVLGAQHFCYSSVRFVLWIMFEFFSYVAPQCNERQTINNI